MKKSFALLLSLCVIFCLAACENKDSTLKNTLVNNEETSKTEITNNSINLTETIDTEDMTDTHNFSSTNNFTNSDSVHTHSYSDATCTEAKKCSCGATEGTAIGHNWKDATCINPRTCINCGKNEGSVIEHDFANGKCSYCGKVGGTIEITLENWNQYFEVYEWVDWNKNAFDEPTEFFGIRISFNIKDEYVNKCTASVQCEYLINQSHCNVIYDIATETCTIGNPIDTFNEHSSTLEGGEAESYISFSLGDGGQSGNYIMTKYNFVKMTRIQGTITFYG